MKINLDTQVIVSLFIIFIAIIFSYLPSLNNGFVTWDDDRYVYGNTKMLELSWRNIYDIFTSFYEGHYFPLTIFSYAVEYNFFGLNPFFYHTTNLILHLFNCLLVFWFILIISDNIFVSLIAALLFGIHPFHVGVVAWITNRKELLCSFFYLGAVISYLRYSKFNDWFYYWFSISLFVLSLLSKSMAITLPFILLLCDYVGGRAFSRKILKEKMPYFLLSLIFGIIALSSRSSSTIIAPEPHFSWDNIFGVSHTLVSYYLLRQIIPFHPYLSAVNRNNIAFWIAPLLVVALIGASFHARRYSRKIAFGMLFFFIVILPPLRIINVGPTAVRYGYIPSIGLYFLIGELIVLVYRRIIQYYKIFRIIFVILIIGCLTKLAIITRQRCHIWKNGITLYTDILEHSKHPFNAAMSFLLRADAYFKKNEFDKALTDLNQVLKILPNNDKAYLLRSKIYYQKKNYSKALEDAQQAIGLGAKVSPQFISTIKLLSRNSE